jgi:DNA topoisomerase-2
MFLTKSFKDRLEDIIKAEKTPSFIKDYTEYNTPSKVHFIVKLEESKMKTIRGNEKAIEETFKLSTTMATTNLVAFDHQGRIHKYASPLDILEEFYGVRLQYYQQRHRYMQGELERERARLTNQARFVKAIIDGDLVVSKKKKSALVAELDEAQYRRFPKVADAKKQGEFEAVVNNDEVDENDDEETAAGANDFDYLLGMAIWSLTQERVDKLNAQIADKEAELYDLCSKTPKDLWNADLDALSEEWQTQLDEEANLAKKVKNKGRRTSAKLGIGAKGGKKRKAGAGSDDDSDAEFVTKKPKAAAAKAAPKTKKGTASNALLSMKVEEDPLDDDFPMVNGIEQKPVIQPAAAKQLTLDNAFEKLDSGSSAATPEVESRPTTAGAAKKAPTKVPTKAPAKAPAKAPTKAAPRKKATPVVLSDDEDEDDFLAIAKEAPAKPVAAARGGRAAAQKAKSYKVADDSDEDMSDGNDRLDDVSAMVKGIGAGAGDGATRFFHPPSAVRPSSSGLKTKKRVIDDEDISADETDWAALAQNSPAKATDRTLLSEGDSEDMEPKPKAPVSKVAAKLKASAAPKTNGTLKPKKAPAPTAAAPKTLSPAAKAYAAKQAKAGALSKPANSRLKKVISDDEDEDESVDALANDILSDDDDDDLDSPAPIPAKKAAPAPAAAARAPRRAAAAKPKARYALSDEEDEDDFDQESAEEDFDMSDSE